MNQNGEHLEPWIEDCMAEDAYRRYTMLENAFIVSSVELKSIGEKLREYQSFLEAELMEIENNKKEPKDVKKNQKCEMDTQSTSPDNPPLRRSASLDPMLELSGARKRKSFLPSRRGKTNRQVNSKACQKNIITLPASNEVITSENSRFVEYPPPLSINIRKDPLVSVKKRLLINACCKFSLNIQKLPVQLLKPYNITGQQDVGGAKPSGRGLGMTLVDEGRCLSRSSSLSYEVPLQNETDSQQCDDDTVAETPLKSPPIVSNKDALAGLLPSKRNIMANRKRRQDTGIERSPKKMKSTEGREAIKTRNNAAKNRITVSDTIDHAVKADNCEPVVEKPRQKTTSSRQKTTSSRQQCPPDKKKLKKEDHPNIILIKDTSPSIKGSVDDNKPIKRVRRTRVTMKKSTTSTRRGMSLRRGRGVCSLTDNKTQTLTTTESSHSNDSDNSDDFLILNTKRRPEPSPKKRRYDTDTSSDESLSLKVSLELKHPKATVMLKRSHPVTKAPTIEQPPAQGMSWTSFQNEIEAAKTRQRSENQSSVPPPSSPSPSPQLRSSKQRQTVHSSRVSTVQPLLETERDNNQNKKPTLVKVKSNLSKKPPIVPKGKLKRTIDPFLSETSTVDRSSPEPQDTAPLGRRNTKSKFLMTSSEPDDNPQSLYNSKEETSQVIRVSDNEIHQKDPAPVKTKSRKNKAKITKAITRSRKQLDDTTTPVSPFTHPNTTRSPTKRSSTLPTNSLPSPIVKTSPLRSRKRTSSHTSSSVTTSISSSKPFNGDSPGSSRVAGAGSRTNKLPPAFTGPESLPVSNSGRGKGTSNVSSKGDLSGPPSRLRNSKSSIGYPPRYLANRLSILNESRLEKSVMGEKRKLLSSQLGTSALLMNVSNESQTSGGMRKPQLHVRANLKNFELPKLKPVKPF